MLEGMTCVCELDSTASEQIEEICEHGNILLNSTKARKFLNCLMGMSLLHGASDFTINSCRWDFAYVFSIVNSFTNCGSHDIHHFTSHEIDVSNY
jgi:hypothetical protein